MNSWLLLMTAGMFEIMWVLGLKYSEGFSRPFPAFVTLVSMVLSIYLLALASKNIPIGVSYTVSVGIGAMGTFLGNMFIFNEKATQPQIAFFIVIMIGIIGLKLTTVPQDA